MELVNVTKNFVITLNPDKLVKRSQVHRITIPRDRRYRSAFESWFGILMSHLISQLIDAFAARKI
jgi:hypothetical protein